LRSDLFERASRPASSPDPRFLERTMCWLRCVLVENAKSRVLEFFQYDNSHQAVRQAW
jgi:hypothetical protein